MKDKFDREIDYLRISVTDRCNLRCTYCMPKDGAPWISPKEILTFEEIAQITTGLAKLGIRKVKITGGEPLVRKDIGRLIAKINAIPGIREITLTTNGILLKEQCAALAAAGVSAVNISLDAMDTARYRERTGGGELESVLAGIRQMKFCPQVQVKINSVLGQNASEDIISLLKFAAPLKIPVRFIEMMPIGMGASFQAVTEDEIKRVISAEFGACVPIAEQVGNGPANYLKICAIDQLVGFISAVSHKFCGACNRIRLTADGHLKTCLQYESGIDLKEIIRNKPEADLVPVLERAIMMKPAEHHFGCQRKQSDEQNIMSRIGG